MSQITGPVFGIFGGQTNDGESQWRQATNQALAKIDATISLSALNMDQVVVPNSPSLGDRYVIGTGAIGLFASKADWLAVYGYNPEGSAQWNFYPPIDGLKCYDLSQQITYVYSNETMSWIPMPSVAGSFTIPNVGEFSGSYITGATGNFLVDDFDKTLYGGCEYTIYVKQESVTPKFQISKFIVTHDADTNTFVTDYAKIYSNTTLATFSSEISGNDVRLICNSVVTPLTVRVIKILINI